MGEAGKFLLFDIAEKA